MRRWSSTRRKSETRRREELAQASGARAPRRRPHAQSVEPLSAQTMFASRFFLLVGSPPLQPALLANDAPCSVVERHAHRQPLHGSGRLAQSARARLAVSRSSSLSTAVLVCADSLASRRAASSHRPCADWWVFVAAFLAFAVLAAVFRTDILLFIKPRRDAILSTPFSWVVPVAVLVAVEFPPLGGHSVAAIATGAIWGLKLGLPIVFAGTLLGEMLCFAAFSTFLRAKAERCVREAARSHQPRRPP